MSTAIPRPAKPLAELGLAVRESALDALRHAGSLLLEERGAQVRTNSDAVRLGTTAEGPTLEDCDGEALERMAYFHNFEPLLHHLGSNGRLPPPSGRLAERWEAAYWETLARNNQLLDAQQQLLARCGEAEVGVLVLKGLATAASAYGDLALRSQSDVDLLCRERDLVAVCRLASELGYRGERGDSTHHVALVSSDRQVLLELHFGVYDVLADPRAFVERAWLRHVEVELEGRRVPTLSLEMQLVFAVAHLVHHDLRVNLRSYLDLAALATSAATIEAEDLRQELTAADLEPELGRLLHLLSDLFASFRPSIGDYPALDGQALGTLGDGSLGDGSLGDMVRRRLLDIDSYRDNEAFAEISARRWRSRLAYALRVLFPSRPYARALRELAVDPPGSARGSAGSRLAFLGRRVRGRMRTPSAPRAEGEVSIKRQVYRRR